MDDAEDSEAAAAAGVSRIVAQLQPLDLNDASADRAFSEPQAGSSVPGPSLVLGTSTRSMAAASSKANTKNSLPVVEDVVGSQEMHPCEEEDAGDAAEEADLWEMAGKSRNATRHRRRKQLRWESRQGQDQPREGSINESVASVAAPRIFPAPVSAQAATTTAAEVAADAVRAMQEEDEEGAQKSVADIPEADEGGHDDDNKEGDEDEDQGEDEDDEEQEMDEDSEGTSEFESEATGTDVGSLLHVNTTSSILSLTADFAMQNVLLQMGLRLVSRQGQQITRCEAMCCASPSL